MKPFEQDPHFPVIVSFIHTHALPFLLCRLRPFDGNAFDRLFRHLEIVSVGSIDGDADRNALPFSEQTPFCPLFCAVSGIRARFFSPASGAFVIAPSIEQKLQSIPFNSS